MPRSSVFAATCALAFCLVTVTTVIVHLLTRAAMRKQFLKQSEARRQHMSDQETQLQTVIGNVKNAATTAAERVNDLVETLREKNNETEEIDLSDEINELSGIATQIEQIGTTPTSDTPASETVVAAPIDEIAPDETPEVVADVPSSELAEAATT